MPFDLSLIDTIVIVMMENRSFDHMLGYLSLPPVGRTDVDGLQADAAWKQRFANPGPDGTRHLTNRFPSADKKLPGDPPHERGDVATQLGTPTRGADGTPVYPMNGFVRSFPVVDGRTKRPVSMSHFTGEQVPTTDLFASQFTVCDRWFAPLPTGTQPNKLMAMSGYSLIDVNHGIELPDQDLAYDWLTERGVNWRVYHDGLPFFALMHRWIPEILFSSRFRPYNRLRLDVKEEPDGRFPRLIFVEPRYSDAPHIEASTDDHAPSPIVSGQNFLMRVYNDLRSNPARWARTVMIVTYDEHGGFFDHVSPPPVVTVPPPEVDYPLFETLGVRVPGYVISPLVEPGSVYHGTLDHVSILKLLGEKFGAGSYSLLVDTRPVESVGAALTRRTPRRDAPAPAEMMTGFTPAGPPPEPTPAAFERVLARMRAEYPDAAATRFPELMGNFPPVVVGRPSAGLSRPPATVKAPRKAVRPAGLAGQVKAKASAKKGAPKRSSSKGTKRPR